MDRSICSAFITIRPSREDLAILPGLRRATNQRLKIHAADDLHACHLGIHGRQVRSPAMHDQVCQKGGKVYALDPPPFVIQGFLNFPGVPNLTTYTPVLHEFLKARYELDDRAFERYATASGKPPNRYWLQLMRLKRSSASGNQPTKRPMLSPR